MICAQVNILKNTSSRRIASKAMTRSSIDCIAVPTSIPTVCKLCVGGSIMLESSSSITIDMIKEG